MVVYSLKSCGWVTLLLIYWPKNIILQRSEPQSRESSIKVSLVPTLNCHSALILMSYGQSNFILLINKYINYIPVILDFICDISDLNLSKIQLQFPVIYLASIFACVTWATSMWGEFVPKCACSKPLEVNINTKTLHRNTNAHAWWRHVRLCYLTILHISQSLALTPHSNRDHGEPPSAVSDK